MIATASQTDEFANIVGMARQAPKADLADRAAVRRIGLEARELGIGQRLADDRRRHQRRADDVLQPQRARRMRGKRDRERKKSADGGLRLQKGEEPGGRPSPQSAISLA